MFKVKLIKGRSYHGVVSATALNPIVEVADEASAKKAEASGYFEIIERPAAAKPPAKKSGNKPDFDE